MVTAMHQTGAGLGQGTGQRTSPAHATWHRLVTPTPLVGFTWGGPTASDGAPDPERKCWSRLGGGTPGACAAPLRHHLSVKFAATGAQTYRLKGERKRQRDDAGIVMSGKNVGPESKFQTNWKTMRVFVHYSF